MKNTATDNIVSDFRKWNSEWDSFGKGFCALKPMDYTGFIDFLNKKYDIRQKKVLGIQTHTISISKDVDIEVDGIYSEGDSSINIPSAFEIEDVRIVKGDLLDLLISVSDLDHIENLVISKINEE